MGPYCSKFNVTFSLMTLRGQRIGHHWHKIYSKESFYKALTSTSIPHKISFLFNKQGNISNQNDISQKTVRLGDLLWGCEKSLKKINWAIPENIHTIPRTALRISEGEGGFTIMEFWRHGGGIYDLKSEGMGEFHRWDFWSRKCRVSSWKTLLLWTFVVRK